MTMFCANHATTAAAADAACCAARTFSHNIALILDAALLAGSIMPLVQQVDLDWMEEPGAAPYRMAVMLDSRTDFGLGRKQGSRTLHRQYDHWREEHPEYEIAAKQEKELSLGWTSGWATLFFYR